MDVLGLLAADALTPKWVISQPALKPSSGQRAGPRQPSRQPIAQLTPIDLLQEQSIREPMTVAPNPQPFNRVVDLDRDISEPERELFSPTVFLEGEVILGVSGISGSDEDDSIVLQQSVELLLNASFTGEDLLQIGVESGNGAAFPLVDDLTYEGRPSLPADTDDDRFELSELSYEFPIGDRVSLYLSAAGDDLDDFNPLLSDDRYGAISEFGTENPIDNLVEDVGLQLNYEPLDGLSLSLGYFGGDAGSPEPGAGLFNGNHSAFVQLAFEPDDSFLLGLTYIYTHNDSSLETETGSFRSQLDLERSVVGNSYGISAAFSPSPSLTIGGWLGFTNATVLDLGNAQVWNYALTLALPDFGEAGNLLGVVIGQEPRLTGTSGFEIDDRRSDPNASLHLEIFYSDRLSDHISLTPGLIWITAPNHDQDNPDILILTVRTAFEF